MSFNLPGLLTFRSRPRRVSPLRLTSPSFSSTPCTAVWVQKRINVKLRADHPSYGPAGKVIRVKPGHMRQQLYPSGLALYCAKDGIPIHHLQPASSRGPIPPPGLSRPIGDLLERLGVKMTISRAELRASQAQIDEWKKSPDGPQKPSPTPPPPIAPASTSIQTPRAPQGLDQYLLSLSNTLTSDQSPVVVLTRPGPDKSDNLYSSIKTSEILSQILEQLDTRFDRSILSSCLKLVGCEPIHQPSEARATTNRIKPIKTIGDHKITLTILDAGKEIDEKGYTFVVRVQK